MNLKTVFYILLAALSLMGLFSCLGEPDNIEYEISTDAQLISFSLSHDSLAVLATTKFSIDQANSLIYNYDSLPYLTNMNKIDSRAIVTYTAGSGASPSIYLEYLDGDTVWVASGDSLRLDTQFSLKLCAPSGDWKTYTVHFNIHRMDPDSVQYCLATLSDVPVVATPDWETLTQHCPDTLEVITCLGFLHPDEQEGLTLIVKDKDDYRFAFSKDLVDYQLGEIIPDDFPWSTRFSVLNDRSFAGRLTIIANLQSVWATDDGLYWTNLFGTEESLPLIEGGNAFFYNGEIWFINGKIVKGDYNSKIYFSSNGGVVWKEKPKKMQPPAAFPLRLNAKVVVDADGKYFYTCEGQNQMGDLSDVWKIALNSRLFDH